MSKPNKFKGVWTSASSISTFQKCKRAYYLSSIYKDKDGQKISTVSPYTSLGTAIHNVLEPLAEIPEKERLNKMLAPDFYREWAKISGEIGGFQSKEQEEEFKEQGKNILRNVKANIHHLAGETAFLLPGSKELPYMWISEEENILLCGSTDFIKKLSEKSYKVIDFKTGKSQERDSSLQLPIYSILLDYFLGESDFSAAYWYIAQDAAPVDKIVPPLKESKDIILNIGKEIKEARARGIFECEYSGCQACNSLEKVVRGEGKIVGTGRFGGKLYMLL